MADSLSAAVLIREPMAQINADVFYTGGKNKGQREQLGRRWELSTAHLTLLIEIVTCLSSHLCPSLALPAIVWLHLLIYKQMACKMCRLVGPTGPDHVVNADETSVRLIPTKTYTWSHKGSKASQLAPGKAVRCYCLTWPAFTAAKTSLMVCPPTSTLTVCVHPTRLHRLPSAMRSDNPPQVEDHFRQIYRVPSKRDVSGGSQQRGASEGGVGVSGTSLSHPSKFRQLFGASMPLRPSAQK
eukprot:4128457-Amphidinium_carterae.2